MTTLTAAEFLPIIDGLRAVLDKCDPVTQQKAIELLIARHAGRMGTHEHAVHVAQHMYRHALQLIDQTFNQEIVRSSKIWKDDVT